ncbi:hypothetical protein ACP8H2_09645 [Bacillus subtilis]|uniref:hypothetical protein n=1 Tax=Bacillus subtilis TaxID=1423 RepID=UPI003CEB7223
MIAKGKVFITHEDLKRIFDLPESVEFIDSSLDNGSLEIKIASKEPIEGLTACRADWRDVRRKTVPLKRDEEYCSCMIENRSSILVYDRPSIKLVCEICRLPM